MMISPEHATAVSEQSEIAIARQVERLVASELLAGSEALCRILRFLVQWHDLHPGEAVKEFTLATEVLGRGLDFDPQVDACVRVQVGRLRSKLVQYYGGPGAWDPVVIGIPRGAYLLSVKMREPAPARLVEEHRVAPVAPGPGPSWRWVVASVFLAVGLILGAAITAVVETPLAR